MVGASHTEKRLKAVEQIAANASNKASVVSKRLERLEGYGTEH